MRWVYDDGGRAEAGYRGKTGDCGYRSLSIAEWDGGPEGYLRAVEAIGEVAARERPRGRNTRSSQREGVLMSTMKKAMARLGWEWVPTMQIGSGCRVHLREDELPAGRLVLRLSRHYAAVVDGVVRDTHCDDRGGTRCVYGYWWKP